MIANENKKTTTAGIIGIITSLVFLFAGHKFSTEFIQYLTLLLTSLLSLLLIFARDPKKITNINRKDYD